MPKRRWIGRFPLASSAMQFRMSRALRIGAGLNDPLRIPLTVPVGTPKVHLHQRTEDGMRSAEPQ